MQIKECNKCNCKKEWTGDDINCPFQDGDIFNSNNWNCGIIGKIRDLCDLAIESNDTRFHYRYCDDQKYATIDVSEVLFYEDSPGYLTMWVTWYKSRGGTDAIYLLDSYRTPVIPTFDLLEKVVQYYQKQGILK